LAARWLRPSFPWLAPRSLFVLVSLALLAVVIVVASSLMGWGAPPAPTAPPTARNQLRQLMGQMEECRGIESLLVMLPNGPERDATVVRLQLQHQLIDNWIEDNSSWVVASRGLKTLTDLREANAAWRGLQKRLVQTEVAADRTGLASESRQLLTGPSAAAYQHMVQLVETLSNPQPS
jgi:hypothetical protein